MQKKNNIQAVIAAAVFMIMLTASMPFTGATEIKIMRDAVSSTANVSVENYIERSVTSAGGIINVNASPLNDNVIETALLYLCGDMPPEQCIKERPIEFENAVDVAFSEEDILRNGAAGIMMFMRLGTGQWLGSWSAVKRGAAESPEISRVSVTSSADIQQTAAFIRKNEMVPAGWIDMQQTEFSGASVLHIVRAAETRNKWFRKVLNFTSAYAGSEIDAGEDTHVFVFPEKNGRIFQPVGFYSNPSAQCGNAVCELGESPETCCRDCKCPGDFACFRDGCSNISGVRLEVTEVHPNPVRCIIAPDSGECAYLETLNVGLSLENHPLEYSTLPAYFKIGNMTYTTISCSGRDELSCSIFLPPDSRIMAFNEKKALTVYLPVSYGAGMKALEASATVQIGMQGVDLSKELGLEELEAKMKKMGKMMDTLKSLGIFIQVMELAMTSLFLYHLGMWIYHKTMASKFCALMVSACAAAGVCSYFCSPKILECVVMAAKCSTHTSLASYHYPFKLKYLILSLAMGTMDMAIQLLMDSWAKGKIDDYNDKLKQKIGEADAKAASALEESMRKQMTDLVWADGNFSGRYTKSVCGNEKVDIYYNMQPLNCSGGLRLGLGAGPAVESSPEGTNLFASVSANTISAGMNNVNITVHCASGYFPRNMTETYKLLDYIRECPANGSAAGGGGLP
jgi:hypothetical protein